MRIDRDGLRFVLPLLVLSIVALWLYPLAALVPLALGAFVTWFFRDPDRDPPADARAVVSPADGRVLAVRNRRVSVFMNVFDVHVCRAPMAGVVSEVRHTPGRFLAAYRDDAPECNERVEIEVVSGEEHLRFTLVAGLVARRVVCRIGVGQRIETGERVGLIRFGSRVDVDLPADAEVAVRRGQRVVAGRTIIARRSGGSPVTFPI